MVIYEATDREAYEKLAEFLQSQPQDALWVKCFRGVINKYTADWIEHLKKCQPWLHLFYVEDEKGNIRAIEVLQERGPKWHPLEPKMVTNIILLMDEKDVNKKTYRFAFELLRSTAKWCLENELSKAEIILRDIDIPVVPKCVKVLRKFQERADHKIYFCEADIQKFFEETK